MQLRTAPPALLLGMVVAAAPACTSADTPAPTAAPTPPTATPSPATPTPAPTAPATTARSPSVAGPQLADGRHPAYLHELDVAGRTVTVDVIQFLTGEEAVEAYQSEYPEDPEGPPNDYWIRNVNPRLRTLPVARPVDVQLVRLQEDADADLDPGTWEELPGYLADGPPGDERLSASPYWLTVENGMVTALEEQFLP